MATIQRRVRTNEDVLLVSFTVDPRSDTPAVLSRFAAPYGADPVRWLFLTGERYSLESLIETSFLRKEAPGPGIIPGEEEFVGTEQILLTDRRGEVRASFDGLLAATPDRVVSAIARLRAAERSR